MTRQHPDILLIEDSPTDVQFMREGLAMLDRPARLTIVDSGTQALDYLREHAMTSRPDLVFLDLTLPGCRGADVLDSIKSDPALADIPVIVLSSSQSPRDIRESYLHHANCYVVKPTAFDDYVGTVARVAQFWLGTASLPER